MKIVFLDIDGVLNNAKFSLHAWYKPSRGVDPRGKFDPDCVEALNKIIEKSGAYIVLSSTWRLSMPFREMRNILYQQGVKGKLFDYTPYLVEPIPGMDKYPPEKGGHPPVQQLKRGFEIQAWMSEISDDVVKVDSFVILDDDSDMAHLKDSLVQTKSEIGLQMEHVEPALKLLLGQEVTVDLS